MSPLILLIHSRSQNSKARIPDSILQVAASIEGRFDYFISDIHLEKTWKKLIPYYFNLLIIK